MRKSENSEKKNFLSEFFKNFFSCVQKRWQYILIVLAFFLVTAFVVYVDEASSETVVTYSLEKYELGMVADRTIVAPKDFPPDDANPISIEKGEKIIRKDFLIDSEEQLKKLKKMAQSPSYLDFRTFFDKILFLLVLVAVWILFFSPILLGRTIEIKEILLESVFFLLVFSATAFGRKLEVFSSQFSILIILPSAFCTMIIAILFGSISATFFSIVTSFGVLCATFSVSQIWLSSALWTLCTSFVALVIVRNIEKRIDLVFASVIIAFLNAIFLAVFMVMFNEPLNENLYVFPFIALNGFLSGILALGFLTPLESILNTASTFRLMDLSDLNAPVMRHLMIQAPGTYNHSMLVATLAENACKAIGANALIARVGAYYHDIGKMDQSEYFTENQGGGENKHDEINPSLSVSVIRSHVRHGVEKARQLRLPSRIIDIIAEHHGNSVISYFYNEALKTNPDASPEDFSYMGSPPSTKESAIVMMADTVEAACRSLENPSVPRLEKFIKPLLVAKLENGQLNNCALTFKDLAIVQETFVQVLAGYYHSRIKYQNQKDPDENSQNDEKSNQKSAQKINSESKMEKSAQKIKKLQQNSEFGGESDG